MVRVFGLGLCVIVYQCECAQCYCHPETGLEVTCGWRRHKRVLLLLLLLERRCLLRKSPALVAASSDASTRIRCYLYENIFRRMRRWKLDACLMGCRAIFPLQQPPNPLLLLFFLLVLLLLPVLLHILMLRRPLL